MVKKTTLRPPEALRAQLTALRYLVAAHNPFDRRLIADLLKLFGVATIREAHDLRGIAFHIKLQKPDVILVDATGYPHGELREICYQSRRSGNPFGRVIVILSSPSADHVMEVLESGASSILVKPVSTGALMSHVARAVNKPTNEVFLD